MEIKKMNSKSIATKSTPTANNSVPFSSKTEKDSNDLIIDSFVCIFMHF